MRAYVLLHQSGADGSFSRAEGDHRPHPQSSAGSGIPSRQRAQVSECKQTSRDDPGGVLGTIAYTGVDLTLEGRARQDALRRAVAHRCVYCSWTVDQAGRKWVVTLNSPEEQDFSGRTLEEALAWCSVWLMAKGTPGDWGHELETGHSSLDTRRFTVRVWPVEQQLVHMTHMHHVHYRRSRCPSIASRR